MAIPPQYDYGIVAGFNGTPVNVETIQDSQGRYLYPPSGFSSWNPGTSRLRMDGNVYQTGFTVVEWEFDTFWTQWYQLWQSSYTTGGNSYSGNVTINTPNPAGTFVNQNAVMVLPPLVELERNFKAYQKVKIRFTRLQDTE